MPKSPCPPPLRTKPRKTPVPVDPLVALNLKLRKELENYAVAGHIPISIIPQAGDSINTFLTLSEVCIDARDKILKSMCKGVFRTPVTAKALMKIPYRHLIFNPKLQNNRLPTGAVVATTPPVFPSGSCLSPIHQCATGKVTKRTTRPARARSVSVLSL